MARRSGGNSGFVKRPDESQAALGQRAAVGCRVERLAKSLVTTGSAARPRGVCPPLVRRRLREQGRSRCKLLWGAGTDSASATMLRCHAVRAGQALRSFAATRPTRARPSAGKRQAIDGPVQQGACLRIAGGDVCIEPCAARDNTLADGGRGLTRRAGELAMRGNAASSRPSRSGRGARATASRGIARAAGPSTSTSALGRPGLRTGRGSSSRPVGNEPGKTACPDARAMLIAPSSSGWRRRLEHRPAGTRGNSSNRKNAVVGEARLSRTWSKPAAGRLLPSTRCGCGARNGGSSISEPVAPSTPATEWECAGTSRAWRAPSGGRIPGSRRATIVFPVPGGPSRSRLWRPAAAASSTARVCPFPGPEHRRGPGAARPRGAGRSVARRVAAGLPPLR
jgi:hypothetical protein